MSRRNKQDEEIAKLAALTIGAVGYGAYKLFESFVDSEKPQSNNADNANSKKVPPKIISSPKTSTYQFPSDSKIYVVNTVEECRYAMKDLKLDCNEISVLGFDCQWVSSSFHGRHKVALLQLTTYRDLCVIVRLSELKHIPRELKEILEDRNILKVGVKPFLYAEYLAKDYQAGRRSSVQGTLELGRLANMAKCDGFRRGLAFMSERYLGISLNNNPSIHSSNWEANTLSDEQITYAALNALVSIKLFKFFADKIEPDFFGVSTTLRIQKVIGASSQYLDVDDDDLIVLD